MTGGPLWVPLAVKERLGDAMDCWWRCSDPDARFGLSGRISSVWSKVVDDLALIDQKDVKPEMPRLPPSRADLRRMNEASEWMALVPEADRRLVLVALVYVARGRKVPWRKLKHRLGIPFGEDGLRMRFDRAMATVAQQLNAQQRVG